MIDDISFEILKILQEKARIPNVEVARLVGLAPSAVLERIRKLEKRGIIDGYEVRLNPQRFKKNLVAFIKITVHETVENESVSRRLAEIPEIQEVHFITGDDGYLVKIRVSDPVELQRILQEKIRPLEGVIRTHTSIVLSTAKETSRIPLDEKMVKKSFKDIEQPSNIGEIP
ncbi:MAG: Lrp/AsnC family transcriptional regulator [Proteobacteria bacterium]|nr:Lrp/AsnC family transcriptional regulator [Pseudomonadota bacterium]MBU4472125.1 Lrp/AsnC family transcriptional regulator [Pseudomonadota bacterium]MCG2752876.1 Lrp/AsnC family transcriptional regulator [Desulfobacteraceae bacterium]